MIVAETVVKTRKQWEPAIQAGLQHDLFEALPDSASSPQSAHSVSIEEAYRRGFLRGAIESTFPTFEAERETVDGDWLPGWAIDWHSYLIEKEASAGEIRRDARLSSNMRIDSDQLDETTLALACDQAESRGRHQAIAITANMVGKAIDSGFDEWDLDLIDAVQTWSGLVVAWANETVTPEDLYFSAPPDLPTAIQRLIANQRSDCGQALPQVEAPDPMRILAAKSSLIDTSLGTSDRFKAAAARARTNLNFAIEVDKEINSDLRRLGISVSGSPQHRRRTGGWSVDQLASEFPERRPYLIDGLLRCGEIMNVIAAPKQGKSWLLYNLLMACAAGGEWFGYEVKPMRVLLIDNELHPEELSSRLKAVSEAMGVCLQELSRNLIIEPLRGCRCDINEIDRILETEHEGDNFSLIAIDAFYRILPDKVSENDNGAMTQIYNQLDSIASRHDASIIQIHHASKGDQSQKAVTDVGAGAGAMTRATDTHITIRPHQLDDCVVVDAVTRSSKQPSSRTARFDWPRWSILPDVEPELKVPKSGSDRKQDNRDDEGFNDIGKMFASHDNQWMTRSQIRTRTGMGPDRTNRLVAKMLESGDLETQIDTNRKRDTEVFRLPFMNRWTNN
jgi:hypothetical protein